jgi:dienelactone hydrolase
VKWLEDTTDGGVRERRFDLERDERRIPGLLWTRGDASVGEPAGLVLIGHGASGHKRQDYVLSMARRLVRHHGLAAVAIDGPVHGDRRPAGAPGSPRRQIAFLDFAQTWSGDPTMTDEMVADLRATVDALTGLDEIREDAIGYWGLSMGTILGLPFVAAEPRVKAAVLGLMGATGPTKERIAEDAPRITCPVLFLVQWDDQLFPTETAFALFDSIGSEDKRLHAAPGPHGAVPEEELAASEAFLARYLID